MYHTAFGRGAVMALAATAVAVGGVLATSASVPARTAPQRGAAAPADCPYGALCLYKRPDYKDLLATFTDCSLREVPDVVNRGSWYNNMSRGTRTKLYDRNKQLIYTTPGAPYGSPLGGGSPVRYIAPC
ncbi:hypothetical protein [Streptomyces sp. G45]|uniref:hypothetical protein n=1 Tax=Streptomyces sp. G45 TaxID=3406627 RepID=UPI003C175A7F